MIVAAGGILVAIVGGVWLLRESSTPLARDSDAAKAEAQIDAADAQTAAKADADAEADAKADQDVGTKADAQVRDSSTSARDAGVETKMPAEGGVKEARTVSLDDGSDGKTIELAKGQSVVVMLTANPSSGFDWAVLKAPAALGAPALGFVSGGDQMGASGKRRIAWTLKDALPPGEQVVELAYRRSFEQGVAPFKTFRFKVRGPRP